MVRIYHYNTKSQDRIRFVKILAECNPDIGLKKAKSLQDRMLNGIPIDYQIAPDDLSKFVNEMKDLKMEFEIM